MKKALIAFVFMLSCTLIPISAESESTNNNDIKYTEDGLVVMNLDEMTPTRGLDLTGNEIEHSPLSRAYGDIIYNDYYVTVPARKSINIGLFHFAYNGDRLRIEWDGATQLNPQIDVVVEYSDGSQYSLYENLGWLISTNAGGVVIEASNPGYVHVWFRSLNYSDVVFYRITSMDGVK